MHRVEIINVDDEGQGVGSENVVDVVHPSNMEVSIPIPLWLLQVQRIHIYRRAI